MALRTVTMTAMALLLAGPVSAACMDEISNLEAEMTQATTGDAASQSDMPASEHQEQVLAGSEEDPGSATGMASDSVSGEINAPASEHQEEVTGIGSAGEGEPPADIMAQLERAKQQAQSGDNQTCMETVENIRSRLGME